MLGEYCITFSECPDTAEAAFHNLTIFLRLCANRGPIKTSINANYLRNYTGGILGSDDDPALFDTHHNHGVSIVGWGYDKDRDKQHWIIRNSWGVYWVSTTYYIRMQK